MFPREVLEKILLYCDGKTLKTIELINADLKNLVHYLAKKHNLWRKCVHQDIPKHELLQYKSKWVTEGDGCINWEHLYDNWLSWHDINKNIQFCKGTTWNKLGLNTLSCLSVCGDYIAIGLTNGSVKVFDNFGKSIKDFRHFIVPVKSLYFIRTQLPDCEPTELLTAYENKVVITDFRDNYAPGFFNSCYIFSNYKHFICGVSHEGHITIAKLSNDHENRTKSFEVVTFARIYSPDTVKCCTLWEDVCIILVNDKVRMINYKEGSKSSQFMAVELTTLQFSTVDNFLMRRDVFMFHDKVIITVTKSMDIMQQQLFELFILNDGEKRHSKKMFMPWKVFYAFITCVYLYGNTLVIGLSSGFVYFYVIDDWKLFDIANYSEAIAVSDVAPVISIDALESYEGREFFIATNTFVRKVIGQTVN